MTGRSGLLKLAVALREMAMLYSDDFFDGVADDIAETAILPESQYIAKVAHYVLSESSQVPEFFRSNHDYGEIWPGVLDAYRSGKVKTIVDYARQKRKAKRIRKKAAYLGQIDSYCDSQKNVEYWSQLLDGEDSPAVEDFLKYIRSVKCDH